jgi:hypothetical protein
VIEALGPLATEHGMAMLVLDGSFGESDHGARRSLRAEILEHVPEADPGRELALRATPPVCANPLPLLRSQASRKV